MHFTEWPEIIAIAVGIHLLDGINECLENKMSFWYVPLTEWASEKTLGIITFETEIWARGKLEREWKREEVLWYAVCSMEYFSDGFCQRNNEYCVAELWSSQEVMSAGDGFLERRDEIESKVQVP